MNRDSSLLVDSSPFFKAASLLTLSTTMLLVMAYNNLLFNLKVSGKEHLKKLPPGGHFVISNHSLYLDPAIIGHLLLPRRTYFTTLEETCQVPILGTFVRLLQAFPVTGSVTFRQVEHTVRRLLAEGRAVHFFPEGELIHLNPHVEEFREGVFLLSLICRRPVLPIRILTTPRHYFGPGLNRHLCQVEAIIGQPVFPEAFCKAGQRRQENARAMAAHCRRLLAEGLAG